MELTMIAEAVSEKAYAVICEMLGPGLDLQADAKVELKHRPEIEQSRIEVKCRQQGDDTVSTLVLMLHFLHSSRKMQIPNILMPDNMSRQRLGKRLISALYQVAAAHDYGMYVVDMVPSFYERLLQRGAEAVDGESVKITSSTDLVGDVARPEMMVGPDDFHDISLLFGVSRARTGSE